MAPAGGGKAREPDPAIGLVELNSVAVGIATADAMVKRTPIELLECRPICPGKFMVLVGGLTEEVNQAMAAGVARAADAVVDTLLLPHVHPSIFPALCGAVEAGPVEALGIVETISVASAIVAADASAKAADVLLTELRLANGLGGKSFYLMAGPLPAVQAAAAAAKGKIGELGVLVRCEIVEQLHEAVRQKVSY
ncbi:MAG: BMC domain-containing protein [Deltaproteobacteria bacterium]|nr:BMC domain-containing protein [Deltaproteobacteria bacterium]